MSSWQPSYVLLTRMGVRRLLAHIYVVLKEQRPYEIRTPDTNRSTT